MCWARCAEVDNKFEDIVMELKGLAQKLNYTIDFRKDIELIQKILIMANSSHYSEVQENSEK